MNTSPILERALSEQNLLQAWEHVRTNAGAPGIDGQTIQAFSLHILNHLQQLKNDILSGTYSPNPPRHTHIPKKHGGTRILAIPTVRDRIIQTAIAHQLSLLLDPRFDAASYGYRPGRSVPQAIESIIACRDAGLTFVLDADIQSFFDHIDHDILMRQFQHQIPDETLCQMISTWITCATPDAPCGIPQGSPLSPLLANVYLDPLDQTLRQNVHTLIRYADDFIVLGADEAEIHHALQTVQQVFSGLKLSLHPDKTRITSFSQGFEFLGVWFFRHRVEPLEPQAAPWVLPHARDTASPEPEAPRLLESLDPACAPDDPPAESTPAPTGPLTLENRAPLLQSLYVAEPGCWLTQEHDRVIVSHHRTVRASVPLGQIDHIAVMSNAMVSTSLLRHCAERRVSVVFGGMGAELLSLDRGTLADHD